MHHEQNPDHATHACHYMGAVLGGAVIAIGLTFLFNMFSSALGMTLYTENETGQALLGFIGFIWMFVGGFIMLFIAGCATGKLSCAHCHESRCCTSVLLGFLMWSTYLLISILAIGGLGIPALSNLMGQFGLITEVSSTQAQGLAALGSFFVLLAGAVGACVGACYGAKK